MNLKKEFQLDPQKMRDGVWFDMEAGAPVYDEAEVERLRSRGVPCVKARPMGNLNREYKTRLEDLLRPLRRQRRRKGDREMEEVVEKKITEAASYDVIIDFFNIEDDDVPLENTPEAKAAAMNKYPDLREEWLGYGLQTNAFRLEDIEDGVKN